ncbi:MAG TPA: MmgE/PrpD family protein, partial [Chloroflexota bacterium]
MKAEADAALVLARFAAELTYDQLPTDVVSAIKLIILDSLGTTLAANTLGTGCAEVVQVVRGMGGVPESTLLGFGEKLPAVNAALANGAMAHALNYDNGVGGAHVGPVTLPAALAVAERDSRVSGREFLTAMAAGGEVVTRVAQATPRTPGQNHPQPTQIAGYFGAAVAAGRAIRL